MAFEGYIDRASSTEISGWVFDNSKPDKPLDLEILDGDVVVAKITASGFRADLAAADKGNGQHAFAWTSPKPAIKSFSARVVGKRWFIPPSGGHRTNNVLPMRFDATLSHSLEYGLPAAISQEGFSVSVPADDHPEDIQRLIRAYRKTLKDHPNASANEDDQWATVAEEHHQEILGLLKRQDVPGVTRYLRDAHAKGITHGITQGGYTTGVLRNSIDARRLVMLAALDHLVSLAESLAVLDVECPDQHGNWGENIQTDPLILVDRISAAIGIPVVVPQVIGSAFGINTASGIVTTRDLLALYGALRIKSLLGTDANVSHQRAGTVCEIGGGLGTAAYYANRLGVADYTIIDLPLVSLLQGYFLIRSLPGVKVALYGEDLTGAAVKLLPTYAFSKLSGAIDLLFNQDSIPEMHPDYSLAYLRDAKAKNIPKFLSINQEARAPQNELHAQTVVHELLAKATDLAYHRAQRSRHWLRAGYVEELYVLGSRK